MSTYAALFPDRREGTWPRGVDVRRCRECGHVVAAERSECGRCGGESVRKPHADCRGTGRLEQPGTGGVAG